MDAEDFSQQRLWLNVLFSMIYNVTPQFRRVTAKIDATDHPAKITLGFLFEPPEDPDLRQFAYDIGGQVASHYSTAIIEEVMVFSDDPMSQLPVEVDARVVFARLEIGMHDFMFEGEPRIMFGTGKPGWISK